MFTTYVRFSIRNMIRNRIYSAINITGLAISLTAFMLMALYIENELSFDRFNTKADGIYRVTDDKQTDDVQLQSAATAAPVAPALKEEFPVIKEAVRLKNIEALIRYGDKLFEERNICFADAALFNVFSFKMLKGNAATALKEPGSVVLTTGMVQKYFANADAVGKSILVDGKNMLVTGVVENVPANSHVTFDFLISMSTAQQTGSGYDWLFTNWYSNNFYTYILLPVNYDVNKLTTQMAAFDKRHKEAKGNAIHRYGFEKLTDIHLHSTRDNQVGKTGDIANLYIFSAIAFFILLLAAVNFTNLSTARASTRAKEVAVKKVAGAARSQVALQFLTESFLMIASSLILAVVFTAILLPAFNAFSGKTITGSLSSLHVIVLLLLLAGIGLLGGAYPAFILSGFKPVAALKGAQTPSAWSNTVRKSLVVFQFIVSVCLIIFSLVVYLQMQYLRQHDLGFQPSQTVVVNFEGDKKVREKIDLIKDRLSRLPGIQQVTASSNVPGDGNADSWSMDFAKKNGDTVHTELPIYLTDYTYLQQYGIQVVAGRGFSEQYAADTTESMLISQTAVRQLGFRSMDEAIGVHVSMYPADGKIIGVFKDFHFESLKKKVGPLTMRILPFKLRLFSIQIGTGEVGKALAAIEAEWKNLVPERPLEYSFLDDNFNKQYQAEVKFGQVTTIFTILAVFIACLGLFGLVLFSVEQRTKEIGIRKILGASIVSIATTLSKDFMRLVVIAVVTASPIAWYFIARWLRDFAYRIDISWWMFALGGAAAVLIALITTSSQAVRAALANPVKSLRTE